MTQSKFHFRGFQLVLALGVAAAVLLVALAGPAQGGSSFRTELVSRANGTHGAGGGDNSYGPSTSASGRFVAFYSDADNLSGSDDNSVTNIFVRDLENHRTILASRRSGRHGGGGDDGSYDPSISANGRFVVFYSDADNLSGQDDNTVTNIFVRDLDTHRTTLVSRRSGRHGGSAGDDSYYPLISANGRFVAFYSYADNLSGSDDNSSANIFVRGLATHTTTLVSRRNGRHGAGGDNNSYFPSISANGRFVAFESYAENLSSADSNGVRNVFVRDLAGHRTILVSRRSGRHGAGADDTSNSASISANGRFVAFNSDADNLSDSVNNGVTNVFVRDFENHRTILVSRRSGRHGAGGDDGSNSPSISANGRFVAFESQAGNLSSAGNDFFRNIFVRGLATHRTSLVSRRSGRHGGGADQDSYSPSISATGRFVAFESIADNLSTGDVSPYSDIFRRDALGP